jgi:hypothetical protein
LAEDLKDDVLSFLKTENLLQGAKGFKFEDMTYLLIDKEYFKKVITILKKRQIFVKDVWKMCVLHQDDLEIVKELLAIIVDNEKTYKGFEVLHVKSSLITLDEETTATRISHLLEYHPMVNARAHNIGKNGAHKILNKQFR